MADFDPLKALIKSNTQMKIALALFESSGMGGKTEALVRDALRAANKKVNASYPIAQAHMKRSIDRKGNITHGSNSKIAKAIMASKELKALFKRQKGSVCMARTKILFSNNRDLARTLYEATLMGDLNVDGKDYVFNGMITDVYDFRFDLIPKKNTVKGWLLRYAGNAAYLAQEMKLMKKYKITVMLDGKVKK
ncbi:MAG: hypothetical protein JKY31_08900 [Rhodobacteraceae bacterium]|nr:hypothetical protein [Paracoccaceae bacterium]MBL4807393.1 hypothetical protein [Paracoccaceae bacterium]